MDPYLEKYWSGVHVSLMFFIRSQLQSQLPEGLRAEVEESVRIDDQDEPWADPALYSADVAVTGSGNAGDTGVIEQSYDSATAVIAEPVVVHAPPKVDRHIEIVATRTGNRVVTTIEVLSPGNKLGEVGRTRFLSKRENYLRGTANYVEIDLLRGGNPMPPAFFDEENQACERDTYEVSVFRWFKDRWEIYPISLREKLPAFRIPLRPVDQDVVLDLQRAIEDAWREGAYGGLVRYGEDEPSPQFADDEEREWARGLLG